LCQNHFIVLGLVSVLSRGEQILGVSSHGRLCLEGSRLIFVGPQQDSQIRTNLPDTSEM
jgi:hypothetical protein